MCYTPIFPNFQGKKKERSRDFVGVFIIQALGKVFLKFFQRTADKALSRGACTGVSDIRWQPGVHTTLITIKRGDFFIYQNKWFRKLNSEQKRQFKYR